MFGADYEQLGSANRVVIPDLLGFGRSIDEQRRALEADDHMDALDELLETNANLCIKQLVGLSEANRPGPGTPRS